MIILDKQMPNINDIVVTDKGCGFYSNAYYLGDPTIQSLIKTRRIKEQFSELYKIVSFEDELCVGSYVRYGVHYGSQRVGISQIKELMGRWVSLKNNMDIRKEKLIPIPYNDLKDLRLSAIVDPLISDCFADISFYSILFKNFSISHIINFISTCYGHFSKEAYSIEACNNMFICCSTVIGLLISFKVQPPKWLFDFLFLLKNDTSYLFDSSNLFRDDDI